MYIEGKVVKVIETEKGEFTSIEVANPIYTSTKDCILIKGKFGWPGRKVDIQIFLPAESPDEGKR